jgi:hypothetical protein
MAQYDPFKIEERLKEYDPHLRIEWDAEDQVHEVIYHNPLTTQDDIIMTVQPGQLDVRIYHRVIEIDRKRGYNPFKVVDDWIAKRDHDENKKIEDMARDFTDMLHKPLKENYLYGD